MWGLGRSVRSWTARPGVQRAVACATIDDMNASSEKHNGRDAAASRVSRVAAACRLIESTDRSWPLAELARTAGLSAWHFHRLFKATISAPAARSAGRWARRAMAPQPITPIRTVTGEP